jgi:tetratricopeptide (TPR) repeat protein
MRAPAYWLEALLSRVQGHAGPAVIEADPRWGAPYLIAALHAPQQPLVWCELSPSDRDDPVTQGNKLAEAVRRALVGAHDHAPLLFGYGMPYRYGINVLKRHLELLGPFTFALSHAEYGPALAQDLLEFQREGSRVVLHFNRLPDGFSPPAHALLLGPAELRLSQAEALALVDGKLTGDEALALWQLAGGAYEPFIVALHERLSLPLPLRPSPEGSRPIPGLEPEPRPAQLLEILWRQERYLEALELAVQHAPEEVPQVLTEAEDYFWERGLEARVYALLEKLSQPLRRLPVVLGYRLAAALALGQEKALLPEVAAALAGEELPELRALYARALFITYGDSEACLREAGRAVRAARNPQTLFAYGHALSLQDPSESLAVFEEAITLAEREGSGHVCIKLAGALGVQQARLGHYRAAAYWAEYGQRLCQQRSAEQVSARVALLNLWALARLLSGKLAGVEARLRQESDSLAAVRPEVAAFMRATLGGVLLAQRQAQDALVIYQELWERGEGREAPSMLAPDMVRALLELGDVKEALERAEAAVTLAQGLPPFVATRADLARGMALSFLSPEEAVPLLEAAMTYFSHSVHAYSLAQAGFYLARCYLELGKPKRAESAIARAQQGIEELGESGLHYLAGPEAAFYDVKQLLKEQPELELRFLGAIETRWKGGPLKLRLRFAELLAALALHPEGLSGEQLTLAVYGEYGDLGRCKVELGRLRKLVPITSRPYRLGVSVTTDFSRLSELIQNNRLLEALELYRGPLLPGSEAPSVVEKRIFLEEALRQAILRSQDPEALWTLAERLGDDLEVWEKVLTLLDKSDPRTAVARARVKGLVDSYDA